MIYDQTSFETKFFIQNRDDIVPDLDKKSSINFLSLLFKLSSSNIDFSSIFGIINQPPFGYPFLQFIHRIPKCGVLSNINAAIDHCLSLSIKI
ncbi:MAG: hypothetical protein IKL15_00025, partial [Mycoplasmataceae bacterium]|nr:hypothetical protein [Mycoplasmataceae bacterium]